jgi:hypothetical protein
VPHISLIKSGWGGLTMKALVLLCGVVLAVARLAEANAQSTGDCTGVVQSLTNVASAIGGDASSYWTHRGNFVDLIFGPRSNEPNARQMAEQEKSQAAPLQAGIPNRLASFKALVATAQSQSCLPPDQLSAIAEPTIKSAKRVNLDQFPPELPTQTTVEIGPPEMPH